MKIRLGYVALSKSMDLTSSHTITYTNFEKENMPYNKLYDVINDNLDVLTEILNYNIKNNIHFYRLTSKLVPLATHKNVNFDYIKPFINKFKYIGNLIKTNSLRVDVHPDQFTVLNSTNKEIVANSILNLKYHYKILEALNIKNKIIILHIGGAQFGKDNSIKRFINNFNKLPNYLKKCIAIENDDKIFNITDCLYISRILNIPIVFDYHHYICNNNNEKLESFILEVFNTWHNKTPKIHFSSPKSNLKKEFRSHNDYIDISSFISFIEKMKYINRDFDIMIEAKGKDAALFRLVSQLKYKTNYNFIDETTFIID